MNNTPYFQIRLFLTFTEKKNWLNVNILFKALVPFITLFPEYREWRPLKKQEAVCPNNELVGQTNSPVVFGVNRLCCISKVYVHYISTLFHLALSELQYSSSIESMRSMNYIEELNLEIYELYLIRLSDKLFMLNKVDGTTLTLTLIYLNEGR